MSRDAYDREAFEACMLRDFGLQPEQLLRDPETDEYDSFEVQGCWLVWRAARRATGAA